MARELETGRRIIREKSMLRKGEGQRKSEYRERELERNREKGESQRKSECKGEIRKIERKREIYIKLYERKGKRENDSVRNSTAKE